MYISGMRRLQEASSGREPIRGAGAFFTGGWIVLVLALVSPLHALGSALLSAHMVQHELLMVVAAPLLVLGRPLVRALWAVPLGWRKVGGRWARTRVAGTLWPWVTRPLPAASLHGIVVWAWHAPRLYSETLSSEGMHALQHGTFFLSALLFWWSVLRARRSRSRDGQAIFALFATALHTGALGALLTFAPRLLYPPYAATTGPWGLTPMEDQQLAGLIMWLPGGLPYVAAGLLIAARWVAAPAPAPSARLRR
jgi:cytochrome c oxidase assembly factor CtaG